MFHTSAPAKVNLSLSVGSPRGATGMMHPIASWMTTVDFCDELSVTRLDDGDLSRYAVIWHEDAPRKTQIDWPITSDLAVRAHRFLEAEIGHSLPVQMKLEKRIPVGGGLGGGSSDAAAMLRATKSLFDLEIDVYAVAASLGSDISFLIDGGTKLVTGFGETLESLEPADKSIVLILPPYGCPTGEVYDAFDDLEEAKLDLQRVRSKEIFNDLTAPATGVSEELSSDMSLIRSIVDSEVHLSGSGSSMFVICDNDTHAETVESVIKEKTKLIAIATRTIVPAMEMEKTE